MTSADIRGTDRLAPSTHRDDIQGLRGIAVLLVVAFHAGLPVPGGYVGVDSFFVVSGFVIVLGLVGELGRTGTIRLRRFYARRARRLLPALATVLVVVMILSSQMLDVVGGQQQAAATAQAASLLIANVELAQATGDYFSDAAERNPLLHTWSLSVEEQFYLVLPGAILALWAMTFRRRGASWAMAVISLAVVGISAASFVAALRWGGGSSFYSTPLRVWEFGVGALLALQIARVRQLPSAAAPTLAVTGVALLGWAAFVFTEATVFPGVATLAPVAGTALLIAAGTSASSSTAALQWRPLVWIGDRSYGWYLWHWPAIVFAQLRWPEHRWAGLVAAVAALVPTVVMFELAEQPIRHARRMVGVAALSLAGISFVVPVSASVLVERTAEFDLSTAGAELASKSVAFDLGCEELPWPQDQCSYGRPEAPLSVALVGDSHALIWADEIGRVGEREGFRTWAFSKPGCPASVLATDLTDDCGEWQRSTLATIQSLDPDVVIVANRGPSYLKGPGEQVASILWPDGKPASSHDESVRLWEEGVRGFIHALDRPTLIIHTAPEHGWPLHDAVRGLRDPDDVPELGIDAHQRRSGAAVRVEKAIAADTAQVITLDPAAELCDTTCGVRRSGRWLYFDDDHLSPAGAHLVTPDVLRALGSLFDLAND